MGANFSRMNQLKVGKTDLAIGILILLPRRFFLGLVVTGWACLPWSELELELELELLHSFEAYLMYEDV